MYRFKLPDIGEGVVEAEVVEWKVADGESVALDQPLVELMTDKASFEIPSPVAGRVHRRFFREGEVVKVGEVLIEIDDGAADATPPKASEATTSKAKTTAPAPSSDPAPATNAVAAPPRQTKARASKEPAAPAPPGAENHPPAMPARPVSGQRASAAMARGGVQSVPAVRDLAQRLGVDLERVAGTGPGGRIMRRDVERATAEGAAARPARSAPFDSQPDAEPAPTGTGEPPRDPDGWKRVPLRGVRRSIARHLIEARRRTAHFSYVEEIDLTELMARRERLGASGGEPALSPLAFIARAVVRALPAHPTLNASLDDERGELVLKTPIHLGVAVATDDGLIVPVIHDATALDTAALAARIADLATRARDGRLKPEEVRGGTFTVTSLGKLGGIVSTPIVNHPEAAILGVNAIRRLPRYVGDALVPRQVMNLSMSVDHRIADGYHCARFVEDLRRILENADFPDVLEGGS